MSANELTAEQVREAIFNGSVYASYDGAQYYANGIDMQAIADELNATLDTRADDYRQAAEYWQRMYEEAFAERTCQVDGQIFIEGEYVPAPYYEYEMECGGQFRWDDVDHPSYCPNCGAKVVE